MSELRDQKGLMPAKNPPKMPQVKPPASENPSGDINKFLSAHLKQLCLIREARAQVSHGNWLPMSKAPIDGDGKQVLLKFEDEEVSVGYWDLHHAKGGCGYEGGLAWIEPVSGERLDEHYGSPVGWLPITA